MAGPLRITNERGNQLRLQFMHLKTSDKIFVARAETESYGTKDLVKDALQEILETWKLQDVKEILPGEWSPRKLDGVGCKATFKDMKGADDADVVDPYQWSKNFVLKLAKLSKAFSAEGGHETAVRTLIGIAQERHGAERDRQRLNAIPEILPIDIE